MILYNVKSNAEKTSSATLCLLYLPAADIARKLGESLGISFVFSPHSSRGVIDQTVDCMLWKDVI
jgi:hypothetical protein